MRIYRIRPGSIDKVIQGLKRKVGDEFVYMQLDDSISQAEELVAYPVREGVQIKLKKSTAGSQKAERKVVMSWEAWEELVSWVESGERERLESFNRSFQDAKLSLSVWQDGRVEMKIKRGRSELRGALTWGQCERLSQWVNEWQS